MQPPTLTLFQSLTNGAGYLADITQTAANYSHSIRLHGGPWRAYWNVNAELPDLMDWFNNRLGCVVEERSGGQLTWAGFIHDMQLSIGSLTLWRSFDTMFNCARARYTHGGIENTDWNITTGANSITKYGRKETVLGETYVSKQHAQDTAKRFIRENAYPWARTRDLHTGQPPDNRQPSLRVKAAGYCYLMTWRYLEDTWDNEDDIEKTIEIHDWLADVLDDTARLPHLTRGVIAPNTKIAQHYQEHPISIWDWTTEMCERGGNNKEPWFCQVTPQRTINVGPIDYIPRYYLQNGQLTDPNGQPLNLTPWQLQPAVIRNLEYPQVTLEAGSILDDERDILLNEIYVDPNGQAHFSTVDESKSDVMITEGLAAAEEDKRLWAYLNQIWAAQKKQEQEDWEEDYRKRKAAWTGPGPFRG